jgi:hypothetical protein
MKTAGSNASDSVLALRDLSARSWLPPTERRASAPPPILLCKQNQPLKPAVKQATAAKPEKISAKKPPFKLVLKFPARPSGSSSKTFQNASGLLSRLFNWVRTRQAGRSSGRRLRVSETVSLGEKRFVAVVQVDGNQYLVGGGATNVALLAQLKGSESFGDVMKETMAISERSIEPVLAQIREKA